MGAIAYLYRRIFANRVKVALRKPVTYFYIVFILLYAVMIPFSINVLLEKYRMNSPEGMAAVLTAFAAVSDCCADLNIGVFHFRSQQETLKLHVLPCFFLNRKRQ